MPGSSLLPFPPSRECAGEARGDPTAQTRSRPSPRRPPPERCRKALFSPCKRRSRPWRRGGSGPHSEPPGSHRTPPAAPPAASGALPRPGPVPVAAGRVPEPPRRAAERRAARSGAQGGRRGSPASPACPPARGAPRRPVTRSGTREGTGKGAKSFKNMSHAHIKFKFTSRPPPGAIGGRGAERGAAGARRARHWLRRAVTHPPGDMTDTKLLRHSLGNASP